MTGRRVLIGVLIVLIVVGAAVAPVLVSRDPKFVPDDQTLATVVVSTERVPANERLDPLVDAGIFIEVQVPRWALVQGAVTDPQQLAGAISTTVIPKHEQIPMGELSFTLVLDEVHQPHRVG